MAYNNTYVALDKVTTGSAVASVTFTSINQGYTDLVLVVSGTTNAGGTQGVTLQFNSDTGTNYSRTILYGNGSSAASIKDSNATSSAIGLLDDTQGNSIFHIMNYANTAIYKTALARGNSAASQTRAGVGLWRSTAAITSMTVGLQGNNIASGVTFSLYGIAATGSNPTPKATGGTITYDTQYTYHTFTSTGTFTPLSALTTDVLVVAGGGGGAGDVGGGAGAGGVLYAASKTLTTTSYACTVGAGGTAGVQGGTDPGTNGTDSYFDVLKAFGGAKGAVYLTNGNSGGNGSGGGGGGVTTAGTSNQTSNNGGIGYGNAGGVGSGPNGVPAAGGGGGGAGAAGAASSGTNSGAGGAGLNTWSSWATATNTGVSGYYAGGGGGGAWGGTVGAGGIGGGGAGGQRSDGSPAGSGVVNTGGGGGSDGGGGGVGGAGGSGIVIVRYLSA